MSFSSNFIELLNAPVGNNAENRKEDVENLKRGFSQDGRYTRPIENGYIDRELNDAIFSFQRDNKLKVDGCVNPGGETEATLISALRGYQRPPQEEENPAVKTAAAAILPPLAHRLAAHLAMSATAAWTWWQSQSTAERQRVLNEMSGKEDKDDKEKCEDRYKRDTNSCNNVTRTRGSRAVCHESASSIYSARLAGRPEGEWPPLQD